jgi:hypothetical protein
MNDLTPDQVTASTTDQIKFIINKILEVEKEYQHLNNIPRNKEKEIIEKLVAIFKEEINT